MKSGSKDESFTGSSGTKGKYSRMAQEMGAEDGMGVAAESLSTETWGRGGEWAKWKKPERGNFYHC